MTKIELAHTNISHYLIVFVWSLSFLMFCLIVFLCLTLYYFVHKLVVCFFAWVQVRMQGKQMIADFAAEGAGQS